MTKSELILERMTELVKKLSLNNLRLLLAQCNLLYVETIQDLYWSLGPIPTRFDSELRQMQSIFETEIRKRMN